MVEAIEVHPTSSQQGSASSYILHYRLVFNIVRAVERSVDLFR